MSFNYSDVENIFKKMSAEKNKGKNASYIPYLNNIDPSIYAISIYNEKVETKNF